MMVFNSFLLTVKVCVGGGVEQIDRFFDVLGLDKSKYIVQNGIMQYSEVIIPDDCFFYDRKAGHAYFTTEYRNLIGNVRGFQARHFRYDEKCEKIYYSTRKKRNGNVGEKKLESFFSQQGYKIIYPEEHTLEEQLNMLANCRFFASTVGSCSHNVIFLPKHTNVILIPRAYYLTFHQTALDQVVDLNIAYVDSSLSMLTWNRVPTSGPFYYYVSDNLRKIFDIDEKCSNKYYRKQLGDFKRYINKNIGLCDNLSEHYVPEYYCRQFYCCMEQLNNAHPWRKTCWKIRTYVPEIVRNAMKHTIAKISKR